MPMTINRPAALSGDQSAPGAVVLAPGEGEAISGVGVTITYKTVGAQTGGQLLALEYAAPTRFSGPQPHWHKVTTEIFYVLEGDLTFTLDGQATTVGPGCAFVPPGVVHGFANNTDAPARFLLITSPAGLEHYFAEVAEMLKSEPSWPPKDMSKLVALMAKYDTFAPPVS